jgi:phosphatidylinositol alpha-1,6-mannosyltransferase
MSRPVEVLALASDAWGGRGGISQYNRDFLASLSRCRGIGQVTVVVREQRDRADPPVGVLQVQAHRWVPLYAWRVLAMAVFRRVDLVFCGHLNMAPLALVIARLKRARFVLQTHGVEVWSPPPRLRRWAADRADLLVGVSRHTRSSTANWTTVAPERLIVVPNTVAETFCPGDSTDLKTRLGLSGKRVLLTVGRMAADEREKGQDRVIALLPELLRLGHDAAYVVIGEGDDRPRLERLAEKMGLSDRVLFLGPVSSEVAVQAYRMADLFLMPSKQEGFGIAFLEAMACGTPALGLRFGGSIDPLDGGLGLIVDEDGLLEGVLSALNAPRPAKRELSRAINARFGRENFERAVCALSRRVIELTGTQSSEVER